MTKIERATKETSICVDLRLGEPGEIAIDTGIRMFDHLLEQWAFHARASVAVDARSLDAIAHHLVEDVAIVLGQGLANELGERRSIARYGDATIAMDDALIRCAVDLGGRAFARVELGLSRERLEDLATDVIPHFFSSFAQHARLALHLDRLAGDDEHHVVEATFKACARAVRVASRQDCSYIVPSTKGTVA